MKSQFRLLPIAFVSFLLAITAGCLSFGWSYEEIGRIASPDGMVDAVTVRGNGGATTSLVYSVYLVPHGVKFDKDADTFKEALFRGDHFLDFEVRWKEPKLLEIRYKQARIYRFSNYWNYWNPATPREDHKYVVELKLVALVDGSALSEGDRRIKD